MKKRYVFGVAALALGVATVIAFVAVRASDAAEAAQLVVQQSYELRLEVDAYAHAQALLLRENPKLPADKLGEFMPGLVKSVGDAFVVSVMYEGWDIHGSPVAKAAQCSLRFSSGVWLPVSVPKMPEYAKW